MKSVNENEYIALIMIADIKEMSPESCQELKAACKSEEEKRYIQAVLEIAEYMRASERVGGVYNA